VSDGTKPNHSKNHNKARRPKDYGINTGAGAQGPSFIPFPFGSGSRRLRAGLSFFSFSFKTVKNQTL
jgi:hypothetical protein